jgi:response regulator RpfG family c-di-GMP phosphodiesterase
MGSRGIPTGTVLVVDDEPRVRIALTQVLHRLGHTVVEAESGEEALQLLQDHAVEVIISDQHMPGLSGIDLLKLVRVRHPKVVRIMLTADEDAEIPIRSINESEVYRFIRKPWNNNDLRTVLSFAFEIARLEQEKRHLVTLLKNQLATRDDPADLEKELVKLADEEISDS